MTDLLDWLWEHQKAPLAIDTETAKSGETGDGLRVDDGRGVCIGISLAAKINGKVVSDYWEEDSDDWGKVVYLLAEGTHPLIYANAQFDILSLETVDLQVESHDFWDICTMAVTVNEDYPKNKGLDSLGLAYCNEQKMEMTKAEKEDMRAVPFERKREYAARDAELTYKVWEVLVTHRNWQRQPAHIWADKQATIRECLLPARRRGVLIDMEIVTRELEIGEANKARLREEMGFNPASHKDNMRVFIDELGLPVLKVSPKTKKPSFDKTVMAEYDHLLEKMDSPLAKQVREYRGWQTAVGLLLRPYSVLTSPDGRLRTEYTTHATVTGRLSSRHPNLQQISKEDDVPWKRYIKSCFIAKPGFTLLSADYSQLEFRLTAALCGEPALREIFESGRDIFTEMAAQLGFTRGETKTLVYTLLYGGGVGVVSTRLGVSEKRATDIRRHFFRTYPRLRVLSSTCTAYAEQHLEIPLWNGRIRKFRYKSEAYKSMNAVIQGGAADIVECIWREAMRTLDGPDCQVLLQIHDALVFEVRTELVPYYREVIASTMVDVNRITGHTFNVTFAVDVTEWGLAA
jgi:DNA polymerase I-like protein with 3'-5' exonuclease and polymerase domains